MAITATSLGAGKDQTAPFTATIPTDIPPGALVVIIVGLVKTTAAAVTVVVSGGSLIWQQDKMQAASANADGFEIQLGMYSAPAPSGVASGTTITVTVSGGTADFGVFIGGLYLQGADLGSSRVDVTAGQVRDVGVADASWSSTAASTTNSDDGLVGAAWSDDTATASAPGGGFAEVFDAHEVTNDWTLTSTFLEVVATGSYTATGTWNAAPQADAAIMVAYKAAVPDNQTRRYQIRRSRMTSW